MKIRTAIALIEGQRELRFCCGARCIPTGFVAAPRQRVNVGCDYASALSGTPRLACRALRAPRYETTFSLTLSTIVSLFCLSTCGGAGGNGTADADPGQEALGDPSPLDFSYETLDLPDAGEPGEEPEPETVDPGQPDVVEVAADIPADDPGSPKCPIGSYSNLPGISIQFTSAKCEFTLAEAKAGIVIQYQVNVTEDCPDVIPAPQDAGHCDKPGPSGLIVFELLHGSGQQYCVCDSGLCAPPSKKAVTIKKGVYPGEFKWDGLNWSGPSDTGNPKGKPFPTGKYTLDVSAKGQAKIYGASQVFEVSASFPISLVP